MWSYKKTNLFKTQEESRHFRGQIGRIREEASDEKRKYKHTEMSHINYIDYNILTPLKQKRIILKVRPSETDRVPSGCCRSRRCFHLCSNTER